jgi:purine-binding chemotaxis protein CheW
VEASEVNKVKLIIFQLKNKEYALPVTQVRSIEKIQPITRIPRVESFVKGVINLRGLVTPIIDLRNRFQLEENDLTEHSRIIIASVDNKEIGLIVDAANDVLDISTDSIEPQPEAVDRISLEFIEGVVQLEKRLIVLLHLQKIVAPLLGQTQ